LSRFEEEWFGDARTINNPNRNVIIKTPRRRPFRNGSRVS